VKLSVARGALEPRVLPHAGRRDVPGYGDPVTERRFGASEQDMAGEGDDSSVSASIWSPRRLHKGIEQSPLGR
jgi:hypothetical protein